MVIGAVLVPGAAAPKPVRREHLGTLPEQALLADVASDQGGCFKTSRPTTCDDLRRPDVRGGRDHPLLRGQHARGRAAHCDPGAGQRHDALPAASGRRGRAGPGCRPPVRGRVQRGRWHNPQPRGGPGLSGPAGTVRPRSRARACLRGGARSSISSPCCVTPGCFAGMGHESVQFRDIHDVRPTPRRRLGWGRASLRPGPIEPTDAKHGFAHHAWIITSDRDEPRRGRTNCNLWVSTRVWGVARGCGAVRRGGRVPIRGRKVARAVVPPSDGCTGAGDDHGARVLHDRSRHGRRPVRPAFAVHGTAAFLPGRTYFYESKFMTSQHLLPRLYLLWMMACNGRFLLRCFWSVYQW